ncbi:hypothetical protein B0H11DRAFT_1196768 [Mycena galericulata]|nr:hypothetical protein B0H11DRAFT_1196768 [Mycena galericulata]
MELCSSLVIPCRCGGRLYFSLLTYLMRRSNSRILRLSTNSLSTRIHDYLQVVPSQLWTRSLGLHLADCRKGKHVPYPSQPASSEKEPEKKEDDDDEAEDENNLDTVLPTAETPLDVSANPDCIAFYRAVDAVCAWTTGPTYLLRSPISRVPIPLTVSIVDLPRGAIVDVALDGLLARWKKHSRWSDKTERRVSDILKSARSRDPGRERGACHCEAGLMASILVHRQDSRATQPETLVFPALTDVTTDVIPIGVAKKCCTLCWILADILRSTYKLQIKLPGRHNRYHIWVPPHWLPTQVLESLETEILNVITSMIVSKEKTACSRSSTGSDGHQTSPPVYVVGDTKAKQLLKKL